MNKEENSSVEEICEDIDKNSKKIRKILSSSDLLERIDTELDKKIVGENDARKTIFMIANMRNVSNLSKATDNLIVNAVSGTGKDYVTEAIFDLLHYKEKEELIKCTPKVLGYCRNRNLEPSSTWTKTALRLEDASNSVLNDETFKTFASANSDKMNYGKTISNGKIVEIAFHGKPSIILTIANANPNNEILRRTPTLFLDEGVNQTKEIMERQSQYAMSGKSIDYDKDILEAILQLERIKVKIPFANLLPKHFNPSQIIMRTAYTRFLDYIKSVCSLHQRNRKYDEENYFLAEKQDYDIAKMMIEKTTSNLNMIPLTKTQSNVHKIFKNLELQDTSLAELEDLTEIQELGFSQIYIRKICDWLVSKKFLERKSERREHSDKPLYLYSFVNISKLKLPSWKELTKESKNSIDSKISRDGIDSKNSIDSGVNLPSIQNIQQTRVTEPLKIREIMVEGSKMVEVM